MNMWEIFKKKIDEIPLDGLVLLFIASTFLFLCMILPTSYVVFHTVYEARYVCEGEPKERIAYMEKCVQMNTSSNCAKRRDKMFNCVTYYVESTDSGE